MSNFHNNMTKCPFSPKSTPTCSVLGNDKKCPLPKFATEFFTECPYGKRIQDQRPYDHNVAQILAFFTECPYGQRIDASKCPYGQSHSVLKCPYLSNKHRDDNISKHAGYTKCSFVRNAVRKCPYALKHHHDDGKVFAKCPNGQRVSKHFHAHLPTSYRDSCAHGRYVNECFKDYPYVGIVTSSGHRIAQESRQVPEKAEIDVKPKDGSIKQPFTTDQLAKCPIPGVRKVAGDEESDKCPVLGILPFNEKCPIIPNSKRDSAVIF
jgi:hypothetical protein